MTSAPASAPAPASVSATGAGPAADLAPPPPVFPFSALAGQPELRLALILAAIDPTLGGVLIEGPRGTAKSTAARALAELLPTAPFISLPLGASLEHLVGSLDLGQALQGHALAFTPGLLARADGGILYVDEVNLLADRLVDALLDAAASGIHGVERDGISRHHRARFTLIGTMNPDEGELRPQLLDRFALCVRLGDSLDSPTRRAIVRQRLAFDADPEAFRAHHAAGQAELIGRLARARHDLVRLPVDAGDAVHGRVADLCLEAGVEGVRADLAMLRAARALAAWEAREAVSVDQVERISDLVLVHRRRLSESRPPSPAPSFSPSSPSGDRPVGPATAGDRTEPRDGHRPQPADEGRGRDGRNGEGQSKEGHDGDDWGALAATPAVPARLAAKGALASSSPGPAKKP